MGGGWWRGGWRWRRGSATCQDGQRAAVARRPWGRVEWGSVLERGGQGLIEVEVGLGVRVGGIERGRLIEQEITLGWTARRREGRRPVREVEVEEDGGYAELGIAAIMPSPGLCRIA